MTPATAFTKAVCERASKDGWELLIDHMGYIWSKGDAAHANPFAPSPDLRQVLWQACCDLQQH